MHRDFFIVRLSLLLGAAILNLPNDLALAQTHFTFSSNTGRNATIAIPVSANPNIDGTSLTAGDEIGVFTSDGLCVGAVAWTGANTAITIWGDNDQTPEVDGIKSGEQIYYRVWRQSTNSEYVKVNVTYSMGNGIYTEDGIYVLSALSAASPVITIVTNPSGRTVLVDETPYTSPQSFNWAPGTQHTISVPSPQNGASGIRYVFHSWSDSGAQTHAISTPNSDSTYTASFTTQYQFTVTASAGGTTNPSGQSWRNEGDSVSVSATSDNGYHFTGWSGDAAGTNNPIWVKMDAPKTVTANFAPNPVVTIATTPSGREVLVDGTTYTAPQSFNWAPGSQHTIGVSSPQSGASGIRYVFHSWSDSGVQTHAISTPKSDSTFTARFVTQYQLTVTASAGGTTNPSGQNWHNDGDSVSVSATPNNGYHFTGWSGDATGTNNPIWVKMDAPKTVTANFAPNPVVTITATPSGREVIVDGTTYTAPQSFNWAPGSQHTIGVSSPQSGASGIRYVFHSWSDSGVQTHAISTPKSDSTFTARFVTQYQLTVTASAGGTTNPNGQSWHNEGDSVSVSATSDNGYHFTGWSGDAAGTNNPIWVKMDAPKTVTANFALAQIQPPTNLTASAVSSSLIQLIWQDNAINEIGYEIERRTAPSAIWVVIDSVAASATGYSNTALTDGTQYDFRVRAYNNNGSSPYSNEARATTPLNAPSNLAVTAISSTQIKLSWVDNSGSENGCRIERKTGAGGIYVEIDTVGANITNYVDGNLAGGTAYSYRVRSYNLLVYSAYSNEVDFTTSEKVADIDVNPAGWDYGNVILGNFSDKVFEFSNGGDATLQLTNVSIIGSSNFQILGDVPTSLLPGKTHQLTIRFSPSTEGVKSATLRIDSNDPDENPFEVSLNGTGEQPPAKTYAFPNPFNPEAEPVQIRFVIQAQTGVTIKILDSGGDLVTALDGSAAQASGTSQIIAWDGRNARGDFVANGIYFYVIESGARERLMGKIAVLR